MSSKRFISMVILYASTAIASAVLFWWFSGTIDNSFIKLGLIRERIQQLEKEREAVRELASLLKSRESTLTRIQKFLVRRDEPLEFIETLENTAKATGNAVALDFDSEKSKKGDELVFRVIIDGTRVGVFRYIRLLELLPYHIRIDEVAYQKLSGESSGGGVVAGRSSKKTLPEARMMISIFVKAS
ncbi:MAG: hypothetical protein HYT98_05135 [Candidatus Sungbacteria bacterium]|nr:hypothetical protein [Candidatus Sungbacteria bacterium]